MPKYGYKLVLVENYVEKYKDGISKDDINYRPIGAIIKIEIPDDAKIVEIPGDFLHKSRCSKCKFIRVEGYYRLTENNITFLNISLDKENHIYAKDLYKMMKSKINISPNKNKPIKFISLYDNSFEYVKGEDIYPDHFEDYIFTDGCINGIHYFNRERDVKRFFEIVIDYFFIKCMRVKGD